jgi:hypothetical protein
MRASKARLIARLLARTGRPVKAARKGVSSKDEETVSKAVR